MANFEYLNHLRDEEWDPPHIDPGLRRSFDFAYFAEKSKLLPGEDWRGEFDRWGATQPRNYAQWMRPPVDGSPAVQITATSLPPAPDPGLPF